MVYTVNGIQFTRRKKIKLSHSGALTDYQLKLTITYETAMQADFNDIRFSTLAGVNIPYWLESKTNSTTADVWIKYNQIDGDTYIWVYYGNSGLSSASNGSNVFEFFDDFNDDSLDLTKWDSHGSPVESGGLLTLDAITDYVDSDTLYNRDVILGFRANIASTTSGTPWIGFRGVDQTTPLIEIMANNQTSGQVAGRTYISSSTWTSDFHTINSFHVYEISWITDEVKFYVDNVLKGTITTQVSTVNKPIEIQGYSSNTIQTDWIYIRKDTATEPTSSIEIEQHQRRIPRFI